ASSEMQIDAAAIGAGASTGQISQKESVLFHLAALHDVPLDTCRSLGSKRSIIVSSDFDALEQIAFEGVLNVSSYGYFVRLYQSLRASPFCGLRGDSRRLRGGSLGFIGPGRL